jgi:hypothetical protein
MDKHKFGVTYPDTLFMEITPGPPEQEKECLNISLPIRTGMHYVTRISHRMQKQKPSIPCLGTLFIETAPGHTRMKNSSSTFHALDA